MIVIAFSVPAGDRPAVAGEYVSGASASAAVVLHVRETGEFTYRVSTPTPTEYGGRWQWDGNTIHLRPVYDEGAELADPPRHPQGVTLLPIPWGKRAYLVPQDRVVGFRKAVNFGDEPRTNQAGDFPLRRGDWDLTAHAAPALPKQWRHFILGEPIIGWVTQVGHDDLAQVKVRNGDDLQAGMVLVVYDEAGERRRRCRLKVLSSSDDRAKVEIMCAENRDDEQTGQTDIRPGDRVTTSGKIPPATPAPSLVFIPEMEPFPGKFDKPPPTLSKERLERFRQEWQDVGPRLQQAVTAQSLTDIARWAKEQTARARPAPNWPAKLSLQPHGLDESGDKLLLTHEIPQGVELPSHSPIVHRRLVIAAVFDVSAGMIETVYITIRGWAEE